MNNLLIIVIGIALLILSCNSQNNEADKSNPTVIDITNVSDSVENHFYDINYLSLEFKENYPIGSINKVIVNDTIIYIMDKQTKSIFIYNKSGKFISVIAKHGKGPGEFLSISDINIYNNKLYVLVNMGKLSQFDLKGIWISETKLKFYASEFQINEKGILFLNNFNSKDNYCLRLCSDDGNIRKKFLPYEKEFNIIRLKPLNQSASLNNGFSVILPYGDAIYKITNNEIEQGFLIKSNFRILSSGVIKNENIYNQRDIYNLKNIFNLVTYTETPKFILFQYTVNKEGFSAIFSKEDKTTFGFNNNKFRFQKHFNFFPMIVGTYQDSFVGVIPANLLTAYKKSLMTNRFDNRLRDIIINTIELSNPILAFYHYK